MTQVWQKAMACLRCHSVFFPPDMGLAAGRLIDAFAAAVTEGTRLALAPAVTSGRRDLPPATEP
jgi:hypothetical protein